MNYIFNGLFMNKCKLILSGLTLCLLGCTTATTNDSVTEIHIDNFETSRFDPMCCISSVDSLRLYMRDSLYLGNVIDVCQTDSAIYVLDDAKAISMFDKESGRLIRQIRNTGRGKGEYIDPRAIDVSDSALFVLDLQGMSLTAYRKDDLGFISKHKVGIPATDFVATDSGFLFYNLLPSKESGRLIHTDRQCKTTGSYLVASKSRVDKLSTTSFFTKDSNGQIFISDPLSRTLYKWDGQAPVCIYSMVFNGKETDAGSDDNADDGIEPAECFVLPGGVLSSFVFSGKRYYSFFDRRDGVSQNGRYVQARIPFFPRWQYGNSLIGVRPTSRANDANSADSSEYVVYSFISK